MNGPLGGTSRQVLCCPRAPGLAGARRRGPLADFRYVICDVFTDRPLAGNQLAVFTDARALPERWLQPLAREINFAETVFVYPPASGGHARIRIFTQMQELPFAGNPILGTALVLAGPLKLPTVNVVCGTGRVPV